MRVIWTLGQANAQQITQILADSMDWKVATVKTLLGRLVKKEALWTNKRERNLFIIQLFPRWKPFEAVTENLFSHICAKRVGATIADLVEEATLTQEDIQQIMTASQ